MITGLSAFDSSVQKANVWLTELMHEMGWDSRERAYSGLRGVLHALRDRLTVDEAFNLSAELPMVLRGMYFEGWDRGKSPRRDRTLREFLAHVAEPLIHVPEIEPEATARGVFRLLARHVSAGEIADVVAMLPEEVRALWPPADEIETSSPEGRKGLSAGGLLPGRRTTGDARRAAARRAKKSIREILAKARADGARPQDLPLLVTRKKVVPRAKRSSTWNG